MIGCRLDSSSFKKGCCSPICRMTKFLLHFCAILSSVSTAMSCTPGCDSCMNSNSLLTTVRRNFQCARKKRGYWPTTYMMFDAITALWGLPRVFSHRLSRSRMTVTRKRFSWSSAMDPEMDPMAQHSVLRLFQLHSVPLSCSDSLPIICCSVSSWSRWLKNTRVSFMVLYCMSTSLSLSVSRTMLPFSSSTIRISSGFAMREIISRRSLLIGAAKSVRSAAALAASAPCSERNANGLSTFGALDTHSSWKRSHTSEFQ
mmetsp:Transcript_13317/g.55783  ORF Transcript_13317/g.55783 Transcript_13317/m.55783 type:complete len:258 (+) Transcript_13317:1362-2135(+)